ncbi:MAG: tyrosine-type recombinase/integrase [Actinomycetota bacterium]|nr:tyrosine-type recombinase/integrase [Actinomycetota bacterium]
MSANKAHLAVVRTPTGRYVTAKRNLTTTAGRLAHYRQGLLEHGLAHTTVRLYCAEVHRVERWLEGHGYSLRNVPGLLLADYVQLRPKSRSVLRHMLSAFSHYWRIFKRKDPPLWVIKVPRKPRMVCRALNEDEAMRLAGLGRSHGGKEGLAVLLGMYMGFRREEVASVRWDDISKDGRIKLVGKGNLPAELPIHPVVAEALAKLDREHEVWVFPGHTRAGHVVGATIWNWVLKLATDAGIEHVTPHRLRHTCLATAHDVTGDLRGTATFARHASVETTEGYTRTTERRLLAVINAVSYEDGELDSSTELGALLEQRPGWHFERSGSPEHADAFTVWRDTVAERACAPSTSKRGNDGPASV